MPVVTAEDAPTFELGHATITGLAAPSRGSHEIAAWRVRLEPDASSPEHSLDREEVFIVVAGTLTACFGEREEAVGAGGALVVPAGEQFSLRARGGTAEAVCILPVGATATMGERRLVPPWAL